MFDDIFNIFSKINRGINQATQMQNTVDSVLNQKNKIKTAKSKGKFYTLIIIVILAIVVLYVIYG